MPLRHWTQFYKDGPLVTCPLGPEPGYTGAVGKVWRDFFASLPVAARIVDIGTGNGAIPAIAAAVSREMNLNFDIHGTDLADIDPVTNVSDGARLFAGVQFYSRTGAENLPYANDSVAAVTGHYALEYTNVKRALREAARVLNPGGHMQFLVHHTESIVVKNARESLSHASLILDEAKIFEKLRAFFKSGPHTDQATTRAAELNSISAALRDTARHSANPLIINKVLISLQQMFDAQRRFAPEQLDAFVRTNEDVLRDSVRRMEDLTAAALSESGFERVLDEAKDAGLAIAEATEQFQDENVLVAWRLRFASA